MLLLASSCNYLPFPCNLIPGKSFDFNIESIDRDDDSRFEILRDTIISQKKFSKDNLVLEVADANSVLNNIESTRNNNVFVKTTVTKENSNNQIITITKKEIYTIHKVSTDTPLAGNTDAAQPTVVRVKKQTVTITKTEEQS